MIGIRKNFGFDAKGLMVSKIYLKCYVNPLFGKRAGNS